MAGSLFFYPYARIPVKRLEPPFPKQFQVIGKSVPAGYGKGGNVPFYLMCGYYFIGRNWQCHPADSDHQVADRVNLVPFDREYRPVFPSERTDDTGQLRAGLHFLSGHGEDGTFITSVRSQGRSFSFGSHPFSLSSRFYRIWMKNV